MYNNIHWENTIYIPARLSECLYLVTTHANLHRCRSGTGWHVLFPLLA
jgi:hypothetical protein